VWELVAQLIAERVELVVATVNSPAERLGVDLVEDVVRGEETPFLDGRF